MGPSLTHTTHKETNMSNPYELRFNMLMEAKNLLVDEYHVKKDEVIDRYHALKDAGTPVEYPDLPAYPNMQDIQELCKEMNAFVSNAGGKY